MFASVNPARESLTERLRAVALPLAVGAGLYLPKMLCMYWGLQLERMGTFAQFVFECVRWIYFPEVALRIFDEGFLEGPVRTAAAATINIVFYAAIVWVCRYSIGKTPSNGVVNRRLWMHWPFRMGMCVFVRPSSSGSGASHTTGSVTTDSARRGIVCPWILGLPGRDDCIARRNNRHRAANSNQL
jgi:hypothetical protein